MIENKRQLIGHHKKINDGTEKSNCREVGKKRKKHRKKRKSYINELFDVITILKRLVTQSVDGFNTRRGRRRRKRDGNYTTYKKTNVRSKTTTQLIINSH